MPGCANNQIRVTQLCLIAPLLQADEALQYIMDLLPSHREDMMLIEKLDELMEAARKKARCELGKSAEVSPLWRHQMGGS